MNSKKCINLSISCDCNSIHHNLYITYTLQYTPQHTSQSLHNMKFLTSRGVAEGLSGTLLLLREELLPCLAVVGGSSFTALLRAKLRHNREEIVKLGSQGRN
jgi:hypothetical protein